MNNKVLTCLGCREFQELALRDKLIRRSRSAFSALKSPTPWLPRIVLSNDQVTRDTLVVVLLRGGMDGLTALVPYGDPNLYSAALRPNLAIAPPGETNGATDLDGFFGLPPAMASLLPAYQSGQMAFVH